MGKKLRGRIQLIAALIQNADFRGFFTGKIHQGPLKSVCVPGLNCYSCPGALSSCPIGALQAGLAQRPFKLPYYVLGLLLFFGALLGRAVCGFLCPFGFLQDLLHKIPFPRKIKTFRGDKQLRWLKYVILAVFVVLLPALFLDWTPAFCKYICPAGTLEGGVPLVLIHGGKLNMQVGILFFSKVLVLTIVLALCILIYRAFCKYLCPLGAIYGCMNRFALLRLHHNSEKCTRCGACAAACPMQVDPSQKPNSAECIRCGKCTQICPTEALHLGIRAEKKKKEKA